MFQHRLQEHAINVDRVRNGKNPANVVLLRGCGRCIDVSRPIVNIRHWLIHIHQVPPFPIHHGLHGFMIAPTCIIAGLGMTVGLGRPGTFGPSIGLLIEAALDILQAPGATGDYHSNFRSKFETALSNLVDRMSLSGS